MGGGPKHGPWRSETFQDDYPVGNGRKGRGNGYYGNGVFDYRPSLVNDKYKEGVQAEKDTVYEAGALRGKTGDAFVIFEHLSPYVIARSSHRGRRPRMEAAGRKVC